MSSPPPMSPTIPWRSWVDGREGSARGKADGAEFKGEAEEIAEMADKGKRILMVGHLLLYHPVVDR